MPPSFISLGRPAESHACHPGCLSSNRETPVNHLSRDGWMRSCWVTMTVEVGRISSLNIVAGAGSKSTTAICVTATSSPRGQGKGRQAHVYEDTPGSDESSSLPSYYVVKDNCMNVVVCGRTLITPTSNESHRPATASLQRRWRPACTRTLS